MVSKECRITTFDNPYDPFTEFDNWFLFDENHGYHTCSYLGRIARTSSALSEAENNQEIERAIDEIVKFDLMNIYRKVYKGEFKPMNAPQK